MHLFLVPSGGRVFEAYLNMMCRQTTSVLWNKYLRRLGADGAVVPLNDEEFAPLLKRERGTFHGFVLLGASNVGHKSKPQRFYSTFAASFHGLSRQGQEVMAGYGYTMKATNYDTTVAQKLIECAQKNRSTRVLAQCNINIA